VGKSETVVKRIALAAAACIAISGVVWRTDDGERRAGTWLTRALAGSSRSLLASPRSPSEGQLGGRFRDRRGGLDRTAPRSMNVTLPAGVTVVRDVAYGSDPRQRFDVYLPPHPANAPVLFMVHGGGWRIGDKGVRNVVQNKLDHWAAKGWIFISVNNRLLPAATPLEQEADVARALEVAQQKAAAWGGDPKKFILMGHSAGAQLVALLTAQAPRKTWIGTVMLDSAALDVPRIMEAPHFRLYDDAFGNDPRQWRSASPFHQLTARTPPILAVCSSLRADSCNQATRFAEKAKSLGTHASVLEEPLTHEQINESLGEANAYTAAVDAFVLSLMR
jgi:acetyl esterase/lipase